MAFAVIDVETTGFSPENADRVVEIGVVLTDAHGHATSTWSTLVNPQRDVGPSHVHGITARDVRDAPLFSEISAELLDLLSGRTVVAHNATFDMRFLRSELAIAGHLLPTRPPALDTMTWSNRVLQVRKLELACRELGIDLTNAHSALDDAVATAQVLAAIMPQASTDPRWHGDVTTSATYRWPVPFAGAAASVKPRA